MGIKLLPIFEWQRVKEGRRRRGLLLHSHPFLTSWGRQLGSSHDMTVVSPVRTAHYLVLPAVSAKADTAAVGLDVWFGFGSAEASSSLKIHNNLDL